ncbi:MAG: hypothetical protein A2252_08700 [Elusimicrobia bacterium RIFOXYA2_FULL_39_19]|nr:MAG: hypothetical protein A2252_08700 [Elusimicrobia bacterium RIFOXYA2_FULL_39_19]
MERPIISIIIPVRNEEKTIRKCLGSLFELNYPEYEVIIINDGSTDCTKEIINSFVIRNTEFKTVTLKVIDTDGIGPSKARNAAIKQAKSDYIAFTDGDCVVDPQWLSELMKAFTHDYSHSFNAKNIVGAGGSQLSPEDDSRFGKLINDFMQVIGFATEYMKPRFVTYNKKTILKKTSHNPSCNSIYKKKVFDEIGGFSDLWPGEDVDLDYRITKAGYYLMYNPAAMVCHYRIDNIQDFRKMMYSYGKVQAMLVKSYGLFRKIQYVPIVLFLGISAEILFLILKLKFGIILFITTNLLLLLYFFTRTKGLLKTLSYFWLFFEVLFQWNFGFIKEMLNKRK